MLPIFPSKTIKLAMKRHRDPRDLQNLCISVLEFVKNSTIYLMLACCDCLKRIIVFNEYRYYL